jgi:hypothetical protein
MNIDNIRIKVSKKYHPAYKTLTQDSATRHKVFEQHSDLFTFCAVLGFRERRSNPVRSEALFWSSALNKHQQITLATLAVSSQGSYDLLAQPEVVVQIAEGYADVGMEVLLSRVLGDYQQQDANGAHALNFGDVHQLEKVVLGYIQDEMNRDPFA